MAAKLCFASCRVIESVIGGVINHGIGAAVMDYKSPDGDGFFDVAEHILGGKRSEFGSGSVPNE